MSTPNALAAAQGRALTSTLPVAEDMFVTMTVAGQLFGVPVLQVRDILGVQQITHVPLAAVEVLGALNLRGRIVTSIDIRARLGLPEYEQANKKMNIVVDFNGELYSLAVDKVGEVMSLPSADFEKNPATLDPRWQEVSDGIYRLKENLLIVLNVARVLRAETHTH